jgi:hypothetical protein
MIILLHKDQQLMLKSSEIARLKIRLYNYCLCIIGQLQKYKNSIIVIPEKQI